MMVNSLGVLSKGYFPVVGGVFSMGIFRWWWGCVCVGGYFPWNIFWEGYFQVGVFFGRGIFHGVFSGGIFGRGGTFHGVFSGGEEGIFHGHFLEDSFRWGYFLWSFSGEYFQVGVFTVEGYFPLRI